MCVFHSRFYVLDIFLHNKAGIVLSVFYFVQFTYAEFTRNSNSIRINFRIRNVLRPNVNSKSNSLYCPNDVKF